MELSVAACGLLCNKCPAYIGTLTNNKTLIEQTAREWTVMYGVEITADNVWCTGCMTEGERKCVHCATGCEIRKCVRERACETCALCAERPSCEKIAPVTQHVPPAGQLLDALAAFAQQLDAKK